MEFRRVLFQSDWYSEATPIVPSVPRCGGDGFCFALPILRRSDLASGAPAALVRRDRCGMPSARSPPRWGWECTRAGNADVGLVAMVATGQGLSRLPVVPPCQGRKGVVEGKGVSAILVLGG